MLECPASPQRLVHEALAATLLRHDPGALVSEFLFPATSDASTFRAAGHPVLGLLPCRLERAEIESIHGVDERIEERALEEGIRTLVETVLRLRAARSALGACEPLTGPTGIAAPRSEPGESGRVATSSGAPRDLVAHQLRLGRAVIRMLESVQGILQPEPEAPPLSWRGLDRSWVQSFCAGAAFRRLARREDWAKLVPKARELFLEDLGDRRPEDDPVTLEAWLELELEQVEVLTRAGPDGKSSPAILEQAGRKIRDLIDLVKSKATLSPARMPGVQRKLAHVCASDLLIHESSYGIRIEQILRVALPSQPASDALLQFGDEYGEVAPGSWNQWTEQRILKESKDYLEICRQHRRSLDRFGNYLDVVLAPGVPVALQAWFTYFARRLHRTSLRLGLPEDTRRFRERLRTAAARDHWGLLFLEACSIVEEGRWEQEDAARKRLWQETLDRSLRAVERLREALGHPAGPAWAVDRRGPGRLRAPGEIEALLMLTAHLVDAYRYRSRHADAREASRDCRDMLAATSAAPGPYFLERLDIRGWARLAVCDYFPEDPVCAKRAVSR